MIKDLKIHNFKAFENLEIECKPITLFLGPNNSGKSSILAAIRLLVQTLECNDSSVPLLLNGIFGDFGTYKDIVFRNNRKRQLEFEISILPSKEYSKMIGQRLITKENQDRDEIEIKLGLQFSYRTKRHEIVLRKFNLWVNQNPIIQTEYSEDNDKQLITKIDDIEISPDVRSKLSNDLIMMNYLPRYYFITEKTLKSIKSKEIKSVIEKINTMVNGSAIILHNDLLSVDYIGAMRLPPKRTYLYTGERRKRIGYSGENAANILVMDNAKRGSKTKSILENVTGWLASAEMGSLVEVNTISDRHYEIKIQHPKTKESQNLADVGYGNSQVIPVLIGGYNLEDESIYLVEEPEIHLHPKAQAELGEFFLEMYKKGVQSLIETHSEHLILRMQQQVAKKLIRKEDIRVYYIYSSGEEKKVVPIDMDEQGKFIQTWPEGFFPEALEEAKKLSKIRHSN